MSSQPVLAVVGATGMQGHGLCMAALQDGIYKVRALTRDPSKPKAVALKEAGAEIVPFDLNKPEEMSQALEGVQALYVVTAFWEYMDGDKEAEHVEKILKASHGVDHYIWSTFEDTRPFFDSLSEDSRPKKASEKYYTPHCDVKGSLNAAFPKNKTTCLHTSFYMENMYVFGMIQNGVLANNHGDAPCPVISYEDIGKCAYGIIKAGDEYKGKDVFIAGDIVTMDEFMKVVSEETGKEYKFQPVDRDTYAGFGFPGAADLANMFEHQKLNNTYWCGVRDPAIAKKLNPDVQDVRSWVKAHKEDLLAVGPKD